MTVLCASLISCNEVSLTSVVTAGMSCLLRKATTLDIDQHQFQPLTGCQSSHTHPAEAHHDMS